MIGTKDTDRIELRFGSDHAMIAMLRKIVNREGCSYLLGEGVRHLAKEFRDVERFAMHVKDLELGGYECRGLSAQALQFAVSSRGGCHHTYGLLAREEALSGTGKEIEGKGEWLKTSALCRSILDSVPICVIPSHNYDNVLLADIVSALYGESWSPDDLERAGFRIVCQERLFNMREGLAREDDLLPARLLNEPKPDGSAKGAVVPLEKLKDEFYRAMNWDLVTGNPNDSLLASLGIKK